jgi:hypothetical protein
MAESQDQAPDTSPVSEHDVAQMREILHDRLAEGLKASEASGKPLLVMVGESHTSTKAAILETLIHDEARKVGVHDVAIEDMANPLSADDRVRNAQLLMEPRNPTSNWGTSLTYQQATFEGDVVYGIDSEHSLSVGSRTPDGAHIDKDDPYGMVPRNQAMADNLAKIHEPIMAIVGADHMDGLTQDMQAKNTYQIVKFDVAGAAKRDNATPKETTVLNLPGNPNLLDDMQISYMSLGADKGNQFLDWQEKNTKVTFDDPATPDHPFASLLKDPDSYAATATLKNSGTTHQSEQTASAAPSQADLGDLGVPKPEMANKAPSGPDLPGH